MRKIHPLLETSVVFQADDEYPYNMECTLTAVAERELFVSWTTGGQLEPLCGNFTRAARSLDGGATWSAPHTLFSHPSKGTFTPRVSLHGGVVYAFPGTYRDNSHFAEDFMAYISESRDGARTFSAPRSLPGIVPPVHVKQTMALGGRLLLFCSFREIVGEQWAAPTLGRAAKPCVVAGADWPHAEIPLSMTQRHTYDQYARWAWENTRERVCVLALERNGECRAFGLIDSDERHLTEPTVVQLSDGTLQMLARSNGNHVLFESRSADGGENWTRAAATGIPAPPSKPRLLKDASGAIYLLHNPCAKTRSPLSVWISRDDMRTWAERIDLVEDDERWVCYPDGHIDEAAGRLVFAWEDRANIYCSRFPITR